jgi:RNA polymerase sigma factor (sigma-70 family)
MKKCPPKQPRNSWTQERIDKLEADLMEITGLLLDDIFPDALRENTAFLRAPKVTEYTRAIETSAMRRLAENYAERSDVQPLRIASQAELTRDVAAAVAKLSKRKQEVLARRFAFGGGSQQTYEEIGHGLGLTGSRVQQIEWQAMQDLRAMSGVLLSHIEDAFPTYESEVIDG